MFFLYDVVLIQYLCLVSLFLFCFVFSCDLFTYFNNNKKKIINHFTFIFKMKMASWLNRNSRVFEIHRSHERIWRVKRKKKTYNRRLMKESEYLTLVDFLKAFDSETDKHTMCKKKKFFMIIRTIFKEGRNASSFTRLYFVKIFGIRL